MRHEIELHALGQFRLVLGDDAEGTGQQAVAGQDRGRLVEGAMHRRLPAPQIVVVHGRQVVMYERIAVNAFQCRGNAHHSVAFGTEERSAFNQQERPQPLAAIERTVAHGHEKPFRPCDLIVARAGAQDFTQNGLDRGAVRCKPFLEDV